MTALIPRNTTVPVKKTQTFSFVATNKNTMKKHNESLAAFRAKLLDQLKNLIMEAKEYQQRDGAISQVIFSIIIKKCPVGFIMAWIT